MVRVLCVSECLFCCRFKLTWCGCVPPFIFVLCTFMCEIIIIIISFFFFFYFYLILAASIIFIIYYTISFTISVGRCIDERKARKCVREREEIAIKQSKAKQKRNTSKTQIFLLFRLHIFQLWQILCSQLPIASTYSNKNEPSPSSSSFLFFCVCMLCMV